MNAADKRDYLLRFNRFQKSRERFFAPKLNTALKSQYKQFTDNVGQQGYAAIDRITSTGIMRVIRNLYMDAGINYGARIRADFNKQGLYKKELKARLPMGFSGHMAKLIAEYFLTDILSTSEGITQTTKDLISQVFTDAYTQGLGIDDLIKQLENTELSRIRARLIARTETVTAANRGAMFVAKETGLTLNKEWLSANDSRVRFHHREENGQVIGVDELFTVGPDLMQCPGDRGGHNGQPKVSAANICNCRCSVLMIPVD